MEFDVAFAQFAPKDVSRLVGLTPTMQRDWRRNGYLPERAGGWASFSLRDLAAIALRKTLADVPLGPGFSTPIFAHPLSGEAIDGIVWWALQAEDQSIRVDGEGAEADDLRAAVDHAREHDRFSLIDAVADTSEGGKNRILVYVPATGEVVLGADRFTADKEAPAPVAITIFLDAIGKGIATAANRPLAVLTARAAGAPTGGRSDG